MRRYYELRHGLKVLKEGGVVEWDYKKLGTPKQTGVDCGLFASILPVLIQRPAFGDVWGKSQEKEVGWD